MLRKSDSKDYGHDDKDEEEEEQGKINNNEHDGHRTARIRKTSPCSYPSTLNPTPWSANLNRAETASGR